MGSEVAKARSNEIHSAARPIRNPQSAQSLAAGAREPSLVVVREGPQENAHSPVPPAKVRHVAPDPAPPRPWS
eukprot:15475507-Alexandrium_andersonii.AAC.1